MTNLKLLSIEFINSMIATSNRFCDIFSAYQQYLTCCRKR